MLSKPFVSVLSNDFIDPVAQWLRNDDADVEQSAKPTDRFDCAQDCCGAVGELAIFVKNKCVKVFDDF